ncbi:MAG: glycosyltransferase family 39 protein [Ilumatobacteraceae bacterium]
MNTITDSSSPSLAWRIALRHAALAYVLSRVCVIIGAAIVGAEMRADDNKLRERLIWGFFAKPDPHAREAVLPRSASSMILDVLTSWDGIWYLRIVRRGYPEYVPTGITYDDPEARVAFFPMYPWLVRTVDRVLPGGDTFAALVVNLVLGAVFVLLVGLLARHWFGESTARSAMVLASFFPGSFVLSFAYSEALLLTLAAACLLALTRERWLWAGIFAAIATATRPNGVALVAATAVAAYVAIRRSREWRALVAPVLSPIGFVAYQLWIDRHAHETRVWFRVQGEAWKEGASFGLTAIRNTLEAFTKPLTSPTDLITAVAFLATLLVVWIAWRRVRLPAPAAAYSAVIIALMLLPATVTARPRFLFTAFPLFIAAAVWLDDDRRRHWWPYLLATCGTGLTALTALYGVYGAIP